MAVLKLEIEPELLAKVEKTAHKKNTTIEAVVLRKLSDFVEQDLKREAALGQLEDFIERLNGCDRTKYVGWSD